MLQLHYKQFQITNPLFNKQPKNYKLFIFFSIISILFMFLSKSTPVLFVKDVLNFIFMPSQERLSDILKVNKNKNNALLNILTTYEHNLQLKKQLEFYEKILIEFEALKQENINLKNILDLETGFDFELVTAKVIGRTIDDWYSAVIINKGALAGIKISQIVIVNNSGLPVLVGRVMEVFRKYSKVVLVTNMDVNVVGYIVGSNQYGVVQGENSKLLRMKYLHSTKDINEDDVVFTSGFGGVFPAGLYIGKVERVFDGSSGDISSVTLKPASEIFNLSYLSVIVDD